MGESAESIELTENRDVGRSDGHRVFDHPSVRRSGRKKPCPYKIYSLFEGSRGTTHYRLEGSKSGKLLIGFHGLNGTRSTWQAAGTDLVAAGYQVLTYDLYGHGLSSCPRYDTFTAYNYSTEFFVDQLEELLIHLNLDDKPCSVMAFSLGCIIAGAFACKNLHRVQSIVLIAPAGLLETMPKSVKTLNKCHCYIPCASWCICRCCFQRQAFLERCSSEDRASGSAQLMWDRIMWNIFEKKGTLPAFLGTVTRVPIWDAETIYRKIGQTEIGVLLLWGTADQVVPARLAEKMQELFCNSHAVMFTGSSHLVLSERATECTATIATFLEFPMLSKLDDFQYLLPFNERGEYRSPRQRCPPGMAQEVFFQVLGFKPRRWFKVRTPGFSASI